MRYTYTILVLIVFIGTTIGQINEAQFLNANEVYTTLNSKGGLFWDGQSDNYYIVPNTAEGTGANAMFAANTWMCMFDSSGNAFGSMETYNQGNNIIGRTPGMLDQLTGAPIANDPLAEGRVFSIFRHQVEALIDDYTDGSIDSQIPKDILEWPAKGNQVYAGMLDSQSSAPFFDRNGDGVYSPTQGDYPTIGGNAESMLPDQFLYYISNDYASQSSAGIELHTILYAFYCTDNSAVNQSVFQKYIVYNRSQKNYSDVYFGNWFDCNLGCGEDDGIATRPQDDMIYVYNSDTTDGDAGINCTTGATAYNNSVFNGFKVLNNTLTSSIIYGRQTHSTLFNFDNIGGIANILQGIWSDGTPVTPYGTGYNPTDLTTPATLFMHANHPIEPLAWTTDYDDYRVIGSQYAPTLQSGNRLMFEMVNTFTQSQDLDNLEIIDLGIDRLNAVGQFYDSGYASECSFSVACQELDCVYPGDVDNDEVVTSRDYMLCGKAASLDNLNLSGRSFISDLWYGQFGEDSSEYFESGINYKHADCNGDGSVTFIDIETVERNFNRMTPNFVEVTHPCLPYQGNGIVELDIQESILSTSNTELNPIFEIRNFEDLYAITFSLEYDDSLIRGALTDLELGILASNIFSSGFQMVNLALPGKEIHVGTATGSQNTSIESFKPLLFRLKLKDDINVSSTEIRITDILIMDYEENFYCLDDVVHTLSFSDISSIDEVDTVSAMSIYPVPTASQLTLKSKRVMSYYQLFTMDGRVVSDGLMDSNNIVIDLNVDSGIYLLQVTFDDGSKAIDKVIIMD